MNRVFTLLFTASCLTAVGQVTYPYNPDGNADALIGVTDLADMLATYGNTFAPSEILVGDSTLSFWIDQLSETVLTQQATIDSLLALQMAPVNNQFTFYVFDGGNPIPLTNSFTTGTGQFGFSAINQTSKELVTSIRLQDRECATIAKARSVALSSISSGAVLVEKVGVPDDFALYSMDFVIDDFAGGQEIMVGVTFLGGSSSDFTAGSEYQISIDFID